MSAIGKFYVFEVHGWRYAIPVEHIMRNAAKYYAKWEPWNGDVEACYQKEILPEFTDERIEDWAVGNMDWDDVENVAILLPPESYFPSRKEHNEAWMRGGTVEMLEKPQ